MAISTTFSNFFSLLSPPKPQLQFPLTRFPSNLNNNLRDKFVPLVATRDESTDLSMSSSSSSLSDVTSSISPSSHILLGKPYIVEVIVEDDEPEERLLGRFRREVFRSGIIQEAKRRKFHEDKQAEKKRKVREAAKRRSRARFNRFRGPRPDGPGGRRPGQYQQDVPEVEEEDSDDDDNWDLPEEDKQKL